MPVWMWLAYTLAVARLTGLVATDEITRPIRQAVLRRLDPTRRVHRSLAYLAGGASDDGDGCPWCLSVWISAVVIPTAFWHGDHPVLFVPALVLAVSQVTGMLANVGRG